MLKELEEMLPKQSDLEMRILKSRQKGVSFCQIELENRQWFIDQILLRGAAISGCALPATEFFAEIIGEEINEFIINFGYSELTYEEILLALRFNAKGGFKWPTGLEIECIPFYGNCFNVDYFSKVMSNYLLVRNYLDRKLQNIIDGY